MTATRVVPICAAPIPQAAFDGAVCCRRPGHHGPHLATACYNSGDLTALLTW